MPKPLPPSRPHGTIDLLDSGPEGTPRDGASDADWRADAIGRSRHSRLADEVRSRLDDADPARAELICARIARAALGDYAPALILLSRARRRRAQALTSWAVTLFDLALRPGLAGLDGDRLAQINAWEFQTEEAMEGNPPGQPVFVMMALENEDNPWPREALDRIVATARRVSVGRGRIDEAAQAVVEALCGTSSPGQLVRAALGEASAREIDLSDLPVDWRRAASYVRRICVRREAGEDEVAVTNRLWLLAASALRPR